MSDLKYLLEQIFKSILLSIKEIHSHKNLMIRMNVHKYYLYQLGGTVSDPSLKSIDLHYLFHATKLL